MIEVGATALDDYDIGTHEFTLDPGERLVGAKSHIVDDYSNAECFNFSFIIGQLE